MEKDGVPAAFKISNFGDDPTTLAFAQTLQSQLKAGGMDVGIDQRASADFGKVLGSRDFFMSVSGYTVALTPRTPSSSSTTPRPTRTNWATPSWTPRSRSSPPSPTTQSATRQPWKLKGSTWRSTSPWVL